MSRMTGVDPSVRRRPPTLHRVTAAVSLAALLLVAAPVAGQAPTPGALKMIGPARLTLDPVCNARSGVSLLTAVRNEGSTPAPLAFSVAEPLSKTVGKTAVTTVSAIMIDAAGRPTPDKATLAAGELVRVRVDLTGTVDAGDWEIELRNAGTAVGTLVVAVPPAPFGVKPDAATPDRPELTFERGKRTTIALKNDDAFGYEVGAQYSVGGFAINAEDLIFLSPRGGGELTLTPPNEWFTRVPQTLFKDEVAEGLLTVRYTSPACPDDAATPTRVFKVKTALLAWSPTAKDFSSNGILLGTLLFGGIFSLALNFFLPADARRRRARAQLSMVARRIDDLPVQGDPRVRIALAVERRQVAERLRRLKLSDTQFSSEMTEVEQGLARLCTRLDLMAQMELVLNRYWRQRCVIVSDDIEELRRQLIDLLRRSDPGDTDIQTAQSLINKIKQLVTNAETADPELARRLATQVQSLRGDFDATNGRIGTSPVWKELQAELAEDFEDVLGGSPAIDPAKIAPSDYARIAQAVFILGQVRAFIRLCRATGSTGTLAAEHKPLRERLLLSLRSGGWEPFNRAHRLVRQMREAITYEQVEEHIKQGRVAIEPNRTVLRQFEPVELRVVFLDKRLQNSAAREEYTPHWEFPYANLSATGWSVSHFFPKATDLEPQPSEPEIGRLRRAWHALRGLATVVTADEAAGTTTVEAFSQPYKVKVTFVRDDGHKVATPVTTDIRVRPPLAVTMRASFWMELLRLSFALGIATVGLIAGAREQILKLDVFPALIAVFLLGFGSDRIKNLFTQRTAEEPKPAAPA